jgi:Nif-specific regulatory protein
VDGPVAAKLVIIAGLPTGDVIPLDSAVSTLGRDPSNAIAIPDAALSRHHCAFRWNAQGWELTDLDSSNGTFVNGALIDTHSLARGDRISAGGCVMLFVPSDSPAPSAAHLAEGEPLPATLRLSANQATYLRPPDAGTPRVEQALRALLTISTAIHTIHREEQLYRELLDLVCDTVRAAEGAILLSRSYPAQELSVQVTRPCRSTNAISVSAATVRRAMDDGIGILCEQQADRTSGPAPAPRRSTSTRSVMAVPLTHRSRTLGAIYLTAAEGAAFDADDLQMVVAIARIAAAAVENVRRVEGLEQESERLRADLHRGSLMIGASDRLADVQRLVEKLARVDSTALITGETGTGKELAARAIHLRSARARHPFVAINCAALTDSLLESELFGHERGAFTGAIHQKKGKLEMAQGGTVLLDEVGELAPGLQSKLLRVLQEREFERVGGTRPIKADLRILSATNRDLAAEVIAGRFRSDLYYRLNVVAIDLPPLRERRDDVPRLARHFLSMYAARAGRPVTSISPDAMRALESYDWPGNVRELQNAIERAIVLGTTDTVRLEDLPESLIDATTRIDDEPGDDLHARVSDAKRRAIVVAFRNAGGRYTEAAKLLGVHPNYLHRLIRNLNLKATLEDMEA